MAKLDDGIVMKFGNLSVEKVNISLYMKDNFIMLGKNMLLILVLFGS